MFAERCRDARAGDTDQARGQIGIAVEVVSLRGAQMPLEWDAADHRISVELDTELAAAIAGDHMPTAWAVAEGVEWSCVRPPSRP